MYMKRTEMERIEREVKRSQKKEDNLQKRKNLQGNTNVASYIEELFSLFRYDQEEVFNTQKDVEILEIIEKMQAYLPIKKWDDVFKKAIKKTGVRNREKAFQELKELISTPN